MKLRDIFTYGKPMFADILAKDPLVGSLKRANRWLLFFSIFLLFITLLITVHRTIPVPIDIDKVPPEIREQLPPEIVASLRARSNDPWYKFRKFIWEYLGL